ncbi:MAG TPA: exodeoxyribonuclease III [Candidatus Bathyarchaeia archaeon]|nr:exodeoxyribonuclease III [Candidatus Bathyarchaeia archaeon]
MAKEKPVKRIMSWNVNGIRAAARAGMLDWLDQAQPDVLCVQEIKAAPEDLDLWLMNPPGYVSLWRPAVRKGYSGVAAFVKEEPLSVGQMGADEFDDEGRVQTLEYADFTVVNAYFPNSQPHGARLDYKLAFMKAIRRFCNRLVAAGKDVILCGDFNVAHEEIDIARPKENVKNAGFLPEERAAMTDLLNAGYIDTFRHFNQEPGHYTWWSYFRNERERNIGWRIDYFCVNKKFMRHVVDASIVCDVRGSDHCPVALTVK